MFLIHTYIHAYIHTCVCACVYVCVYAPPVCLVPVEDIRASDPQKQERQIVGRHPVGLGSKHESSVRTRSTFKC